MKSIVLMFWLTLFVGVAAFGQDSAPAPVFKPDEFWHFDIKESRAASTSRALKGAYQVLFTDNTFRVSAVGDEKETLDRTQAQRGRLLAMFGRGDYFGGQYLKFPLSVGQKWELTYRERPTGSRVEELWTAHVEVPGIEEVKTAAGTFRTFKVVRTNVRGAQMRTITLNYSPETKCFVKAQYEFGDGAATIELVKFGSQER
jgi:hypothetical protein